MAETLRSTPLSTLVHQWKETGSTLARVSSSYLNLALLLSKESEKSDIAIKDLTSSIDAALHPEGLISTLSRQLSKSREVLSKARNRLSSPIHNLPTEILSKIFIYAVNDDNSNSPVYIEFTVRTYYHQLYALLEVCSRWRKIGLSMPILWNLVPVIRDVRFTLSNSATSRILERSGILPLDLAVMIPRDIPVDLTQKLAQYAHRFQTINLLSEEPFPIREILHSLMKCNVIASLSELSLCVTDLDNIDRLGDELYYFVPPWSREHPLFQQLVQSLTRFRFNGATFGWSQITFSTKLVELRVQTVIFGEDTLLNEFLLAISTAARLQKLELKSIISFPTIDSSSVENTPQVVLPELQSLVLDNLYFNTLSILLRSITPHTYRLTLLLTDKCGDQIFFAREPETGRETVGFAALRAVLDDIPVDTLLLTDEDDSLNYRELKVVLGAVKSLNTIKINERLVDRSFCKVLTQPMAPKIRNLYLTNCKIADEEGLKNLILSHDLRMILLGGRIYLESKTELSKSEPLEGSEELVDWLVSNVPDVRLNLGGAFMSPEFHSAIWELWGG